MCPQTFLKQIAVDGLRGCRALAGGDNHLTVRRSHTTRGVDTVNSRPQIQVDYDLAVPIDLRTQTSRKFVQINISAGGKQRIDAESRRAFELQRRITRSLRADRFAWKECGHIQ